MKSAVLTMLVTILAGIAESTAREIDFGKQVFPVLQSNCLECHGAKDQKSGLRLDTRSAFLQGGSSGPIVVQGNAAKSDLFRHINLSKGHDDVMPNRGEPLSRRDRNILRDWINAGAEWPDSFIAPKHWSYVAPKKSKLPRTSNASWGRNPIDAFVLEKIEAASLKPAAEATKEQLIRRLSLDLIGIPPAPSEVAAFVADKSPKAFENLVDRLLKSDEFGVRWARPWLDYARYADSHGYQRDNFREIWAYRDWVVNALNADMPYDQFTIEQLAGDLIPNATEAQKIATGFNQNAPTNVEAGTEPEETRVNQIFDRVNTLGTVWLGSTLECSQCHDHKYDPFTHRDYYGMFAFFNNTELEADRTNPATPGSIKFKGSYLDLADPKTAATRDDLAKTTKTLKSQIKRRTAQLNKSDPAWEKLVLAQAGQKAQHHPLDIKKVEVTAGSTYKHLADKSVLFFGKVPEKEDYVVIVETGLEAVTGLKIEFLADDSLTAKGPARGNGNRPNTVLNDFAITAAPVSGGKSKPVEVASISADFSQRGWNVQQLLDDNKTTGWAINPQFGKDHWFQPVFAEPQSFKGGTQYRISLIQQLGAGRQAGRVRVSAITGNPDKGAVSGEIISIVNTSAKKRTKAQIKKLQGHRAGSDSQLKKLNAQLTSAAKDLKALEIPKTLVMSERKEMRPSFLFKRGVYTQKGEPIDPLVPAILHPVKEKHYRYAGEIIDRPNRLVLAQWLMDRDNPLVARTAVNRFWQELFGRGIVTTPEDFGIKGDSPTHPELLDWLAVYFAENNWSIKATLKTIVMSATYRQSSRITPAQRAADPENALFARGPRFRMSAEMIRDNALAIAGLLSTGKGGPSIKPYQPAGVWSKVGGDNYAYKVSPGEKQYRRGIYVVWKRGAPYPSFVNFDANERMACRVKRATSNTPLQALTLMNDPAYVEAAKAFAKRIVTEETDLRLSHRIRHAFKIALSREPTKLELATLDTLFREQMSAAKSDSEAAKEFIGKFEKPKDMNDAEFVGWYAVATALLNLDETITKG
jgi:hypothetical protein